MCALSGTFMTWQTSEINPGISWAGLHRATFEFKLFQSFATADEETLKLKLENYLSPLCHPATVASVHQDNLR